MSNLFRRIILPCTFNAPKKLYALYFIDCELQCKCSNWTMTLVFNVYTNLDETKIRGLTDRGHSETETRHAAHRIVLVKVKEAPLTPVTFDTLNILLKNQVPYKMFKNCNSNIGLCRSCINICVMGENQLSIYNRMLKF